MGINISFILLKVLFRFLKIDNNKCKKTIRKTIKNNLYRTYFCRTGEAVALVAVAVGVTLEVDEEAHTALSSKCMGRGDCSAVIGVPGGDICIGSSGGADGDTSIADGCTEGVNRGV